LTVDVNAEELTGMQSPLRITEADRNAKGLWEKEGEEKKWEI